MVTLLECATPSVPWVARGLQWTKWCKAIQGGDDPGGLLDEPSTPALNSPSPIPLTVYELASELTVCPCVWEPEDTKAAETSSVGQSDPELVCLILKCEEQDICRRAE